MPANEYVSIGKKAIARCKGLLLVLISMSVIQLTALAQTLQVSGTVRDGKGHPVEGASVIVKGTTSGTSTDANGRFTLSTARGSILVFSYTGFETQEKKVQGAAVDLVLRDSDASMGEVVVVGYGTTRKKDLTGAISVVRTENIANRVSTDLAGAIKGLAAGVKVTSTGQAGESSSITIRGIGNLTNNNPLFVVDGFPTGGGMDLNLQDIESIQILKDASSAAIYGSRAANGVVIITTKKGKEGPMKVDANSQVSVNWLPRYKLLNRDQYIHFDDMAYDEAIKAGIVTHRQNHYPGNTDWQDAVLKQGIKQNYNLSLSGGSRTGQYFVSLNKLSDGGTVYGTSFDRYMFRVNTAGEKGAFSYGENLYFLSTRQDGMTGNPFADLISMPPTVRVHDPLHQPGGYGFGNPDSANTYALNPVAQQDIMGVVNKSNTIRGNVFAQVRLFNALTAKLNFGYTADFENDNTLRKRGNWTMGQANDDDYITKSMNKHQTLLVENTYNFKKSFGRHDIEALAGASYQKDNTEDVWTTRLNPLVINGQYYNSLNSATGAQTGGGQYGEARLLSWFGRISYTYDDKYLLTGTIRRDGSSRLPESGRWGNFPSIAGAWRISKESFFDVPFISDLKIRANYGVLGNANIGYWDYIPVMNTSPRAVFGSPETVVIGTTQSQLVNTNITWEKKIQQNYGVDAAFLNNKLTFTGEYFIAKSKDLLVALPILASTGNNGGNPIVNAASLQNKGIELTLGWKDKLGDVSYGVSANFTSIRNKVLDLGYGKVTNYTFLTKAGIGQSLGSFYLYKTLGIFQTQAEVDNYKNKNGTVIQPNAKPGDIKYDDYNGDGQISSDDRQIVGSGWAKYEAGLSLTAQWKGFDLLVQGYGRFGYKIWNGARATAGDFANNNNTFSNISPWTEQNHSNTQPRLIFGDTRNSRGDQDRWLENGSFFRIGEIALGYNLPQHICDKLRMRNLRAGITATNLITFTGYSGLDPDFKDTGIFTLAVDGPSYPNPRSVLFSLSFGF
ncbi:MAG: TonB-dependent receptor [Chitinophagaceae bacterium]|nr:TonB-dependent receptor [Chitinophagaceae bacterium]